MLPDPRHHVAGAPVLASRAAGAHWLQAANPWWTGAAPAADLPAPDASTRALLALLAGPEPPWLTVVDGARQTGKSQLLGHLLAAHFKTGGAPQRLCRIGLEHGALRWHAAGALVEDWQRQDGASGPGQMLLVDDFHLWPTADQDSLAQLALDPDRRVVVAGVALEACVRRWRGSGMRVAHCQLAPWPLAVNPGEMSTAVALPAAPRSLRDLFDWAPGQFSQLVPAVQALQPAFERHLQQGGFPAASQASSVAEAHRHLREQVVVRSLRWDAVGLHGVRRVDQLERALLVTALDCGQLLDMPALCAQLEVERPTVRHFLDLLEQAGLLVRLPPLGYGREIQRARPLLALSDPGLLAALCGQACQAPQAAQLLCALAAHLRLAYGTRGGVLRTLAPGRAGQALAVAARESVLPFALHWKPAPVTARDMAGLVAACARSGIPRAYVATRAAGDFGLLPGPRPLAPAVMRVPAALLCHWLACAAGPALQTG